jgi:hypothetical protein
MRAGDYRAGFLAVAVAAAVMFAAGCVTYDERLTVESDCSGTVTMDLVVPEQIIGLSEKAGRSDNIFSIEGITKRFTGVEGIRLLDAAVTARDDGHREVRIGLGFDSPEAFERISTVRGGDTGFLGFLTLVREDGTLRYRRTVTMRDTTRAPTGMYQKQFQDFPWSYTVRLPGRITGSNADEIARDGGVTWHFTLAELAAGPVVMEAVATQSGVGRLVTMGVIGIVFAGVFVGLYLLIHRMEGRHGSGHAPVDGDG